MRTEEGKRRQWRGKGRGRKWWTSRGERKRRRKEYRRKGGEKEEAMKRERGVQDRRGRKEWEEREE